MNFSKKTLTTLAWFGVIAVTVTLAVYAYLGFFSRYMADDYCLLVDLNAGNIFVSSWKKYLFKSNRFSNLFVLGLWELFPHNIAFVPALHIILWVVGLYWLLNELNKLFELKFEGEIPPKVAISEAVRLSRKFGTPEGGAFVNAILDAIFQMESGPCLSKPVLSTASP